MLDPDNLPASIEALHDEAEELASMARNAQDPTVKTRLRSEARQKVRQAARLREQSEALA